MAMRRILLGMGSALAGLGLLLTQSVRAEPLPSDDSLSVTDLKEAAIPRSLPERGVVTVQLGAAGSVNVDLAPAGNEALATPGVRLGTVEGYADVKNAVILSREDGSVLAEIRDFAHGFTHYVRVAPNGASQVRSVDTGLRAQAFDPLFPDERTPTNSVKDAQAVRLPALRARAERAGAVYVDVLVAYDQAAKTWTDANAGGVDAFAELSVARMNAVLVNSGLDDKFLFRLVGVVCVSVNGGVDLGGVLDQVTDGIGGWADIRAAREACKADVVTTLVDTGSPYGWTGLGWSLEGPGEFSLFSDFAYNVCAVRSVEGSDTMLHEIGHNMGAGHADSNYMDSGYGPQLDAFSSGYYFTAAGTDYHTVMAYNTDRTSHFYEDAPYFSTPTRSYNGTTVGDATHDNVRTLARTCAAVAAFRGEAVPVEAGGTPGDPGITPPSGGGETGTAPTLYASPASTAFEGNALYTGWIRGDDGALKGVLQIKAGKPKDGASKLAVTYTPAGGKKQKIKDFAPASAVVGGKPTVMIPGIGSVRLGGLSLAGPGTTVQVGKNLLKDPVAKAAAASRLANLAGVWTFALRTSAGDIGLSVNMGRNGKAKLTGMLPDGSKVSGSGEGVLGEKALAIPFICAKKGSLAFVLWIQDDGKVLVSDLGPVVLPDGTSCSATAVKPAAVAAAALSDGEYLFVAGPYSQPFVLSGGKADAGKKEANPGALKLRVAAKTGLLTGAFKDDAGRYKVAGVVVDGTFYGTASVKGGTVLKAEIKAR